MNRKIVSKIWQTLIFAFRYNKLETIEKSFLPGEKMAVPGSIFDVAGASFSRQTNKFSILTQRLVTSISHTFSVSHNGRLTFLCTRNGKVIVQIAVFTHGFYHFAEYNATKKFWWSEEVCQKTNNPWEDYTASYWGKVNWFMLKKLRAWDTTKSNLPVTGI